MANRKKKEAIYSALYFLSTAFLTYHLELIDLMSKDEDKCLELQKLQKAIDEVISVSSINSMPDRQKVAIIKDHENLKKMLDNFMKL